MWSRASPTLHCPPALRSIHSFMVVAGLPAAALSHAAQAAAAAAASLADKGGVRAFLN